MKNKTDIFINYRRDDSKGYAALIADKVSSLLPGFQIFFDWKDIDYGESIPGNIQQALENCKVLLCVIGPDWLEILSERAALPDKDWVIEEILSAHKNGAKILAVLLPDTEKPGADALPKELQFLFDFDVFTFPSSKTIDLETRAVDLAKALLRKIYGDDPSKIIGNKLRDYYLNNNQFTSIALPNTEVDQLENSIAMDRYFISPSYINMSDLQTRDSINDIENQQSVVKIKQVAHLNKIIPPDFAAFRLLIKNGNALVIGNPGTGKSTFARWLSYIWTKKKDSTILPVYISLREVNWEADNSLFSKFRKILNLQVGLELNYLSTKLAQQVIWLLDGYDELNHVAKIKLYNTITELKAKHGTANYILLTRPYGLLHNPGFSFTQQIELAGFLPGQMKDYVETFLDLRKQKEKKKDFLDLLDSNPLLRDYAYNPMMLSFILSIYLKVEQPKAVLGAIDSQYDLQARIYQLIMDRELDKGTEEKNWKQLSLTKEQAELSYRMQIEKQFVRTGYSHDSWVKIAKKLNNLGLARLISYEQDSRTNFSFNSVTFQEFLASKFLNRSFDDLSSSSVTTPAFSYLIRDSFFWNTSKMLIGGLWESTKQDKKKAKAIIEGFRTSYLSDKNINAYYSYLVHLAECPKSFVQEQLNQTDLSELYSLYVYNGHVATLWNSALNSAISRLYFKLDNKHQNIFQDLILNDLLPSAKEQAIDEKSDMYSVPNGAKLFALNLDLYNELYFIKALTDFLDTNFTKNKPSSDYIYYTFESISFIVDELLVRSTLKNLADTKEQLTNGLSMLPSIHFTAATRLKTKIEQDNKNDSLAQKIDLLNQQLLDDSTDSETIFESLSDASEIFFTQYSNRLIRTEEEKTVVVNFIRTAITITTNYKLDDEIEELFQLAAEAVQQTNDSEIFEAVYDFAVVANVSYSSVHFTAHEKLFDWYQASLETAASSKDTARFSMLTTALTNTESLQARFIKLRAAYIKLMSAYIDEHHSYFEKYNGQFTTVDFINTSKGEFEILRPFNKLIYSCQEDNLLSEADKLSILDFVLEPERKKLKYFEDNFIPGFMSTQFHLHKEEHWSFVRVGLSSGKIANTISIIRNKQLFRIPSNINLLSELSTFLVDNYNNSYFEERRHLFVEFSCRSLRLMIKHELQNQKLIDDISILLSEASTISHFGTEECIKGIDGRDQMAYLLLFIVTSNYLIDEKFDYNASFREEYVDRADFITGLIEIFTKVDGLDLDALSSLFHLLGEEMVDKVRFKIKANDLDFVFDRSKFEGLLE